MKSELTSGEVTFILILDFRPMNAIITSPFPKPSGTYKIPILPTNKSTSVTIDVGTTGVTANKYVVYTEEEVEFTLPENRDDFFIIATEANEPIATEELISLRSEQGGGKVYDITLTTLFEDGSTEITHLYIIQE